MSSEAYKNTFISFACQNIYQQRNSGLQDIPLFIDIQDGFYLWKLENTCMIKRMLNSVLSVNYKARVKSFSAVYYLIRERISPKNAIEFAVNLEKQYAKVLISRIWISKPEKQNSVKKLFIIFWKFQIGGRFASPERLLQLDLQFVKCLLWSSFKCASVLWVAISKLKAPFS